MTPVQYLFLQQMIDDKGFKRIAEVGVWKAAFSTHILSNCPQVEKVYSIDPWKVWPKKDYVDGKNNHSQKKFDSIYNRVQKRLSVFEDRSELIRDTSVGGSQHVKDGELDLVWIDANHGYEWVKEDIHTWVPKVRPGGIVAGDDYNPDFLGCIKAVNEYCYIRDIVFSIIPGGVWYFEKDKIYLKGGRQ